MTVRDYCPEDFDVICGIDRRCFPPGIAYSPEDIAMTLLQPGAFIIVGDADGKIAGFLLAAAERGNRAHIITIDVLGEYRRSGLGTMLLKAAHGRLAPRNVVLEVSVENAAAMAFYKRHGYEVVRRLKNYYLGREDAWQMQKKLSADFTD